MSDVDVGWFLYWACGVGCSSGNCDCLLFSINVEVHSCGCAADENHVNPSVKWKCLFAINLVKPAWRHHVSAEGTYWWRTIVTGCFSVNCDSKSSCWEGSCGSDGFDEDVVVGYILLISGTFTQTSTVTSFGVSRLGEGCTAGISVSVEA